MGYPKIYMVYPSRDIHGLSMYVYGVIGLFKDIHGHAMDKPLDDQSRYLDCPQIFMG